MNKELLYSVTKKDLKIETMRGSGKGGQHRNKTDSAVRITHPESGAIGYSEDGRSQLQNKRTAFRRMINSQEFQLWNIRKAAILMGLRKSPQEIEREVAVLMSEENLKIEYLEV